MSQGKALVLFSGGQDSTTALFWAMSHFSRVEAITFDYKQRHAIEIEYSKKIVELVKIQQTILPIETFSVLGGNVLTVLNQWERGVQDKEDSRPNTYVAGRNLIFLIYSAALAVQKEIKTIIGGMNQVDYSGYPDCREKSIQAMEQAINLGMECDLKIRTPLMNLSKEEIWELSYELNCFELIKGKTMSCYQGIIGGCGICQACILRDEGLKKFEEKMKGSREK